MDFFKIFSSSSILEWAYTFLSAFVKRIPSMIEAWFSSSEMTISSFVRMLDKTPWLVVKPDWNTRAASVFLKAASFFSSRSCIVIVPAMVRTDPVPAPNSSIASFAAFISLGCEVRPK